jgi:hypothetical protein
MLDGRDDSICGWGFRDADIHAFAHRRSRPSAATASRAQIVSPLLSVADAVRVGADR